MADRRGAGGRGVSITINYVLIIAITTVLVSGLLIAGSGFVQRQQERVARDELEVVGQRVAADIEHVDRLAAASGKQTVTLNQSLPSAAAGRRYEIELSEGPGQLVLSGQEGDVSVVVAVDTRESLAPAEITGGAIGVVYNGSDITIKQRGP